VRQAHVELTAFLWPELLKTAKTHRWTFKRHWWRCTIHPSLSCHSPVP